MFDAASRFEDSLVVCSPNAPCDSSCSLENTPENTATSQTPDSVLVPLVPSGSSSDGTSQNSSPINYVVSTSLLSQTNISSSPAPSQSPPAHKPSEKHEYPDARSPEPPISQASGSASGGDSVSPVEISSPDISVPNTQANPSIGATSGERSPYRCEWCGEVFEKLHLRNNHKNRKHIRRYKCTIENCQQNAFGLRRDLDRHLRSRHPKQYPLVPFSCPYSDCPLADKAFSRKDNLNRHIRIRHAELRPDQS